MNAKHKYNISVNNIDRLNEFENNLATYDLNNLISLDQIYPFLNPPSRSNNNDKNGDNNNKNKTDVKDLVSSNLQKDKYMYKSNFSNCIACFMFF